MLLTRLDAAAGATSLVRNDQALLRSPDRKGPESVEDDPVQHLLNAFLIAAGMNQILEDYQHRDTWSFHRAARRLAANRDRALQLVAGGLRRTSGAVQDIRSRTPSARRLLAWQGEFTVLIDQLADAVAGCCHLIDRKTAAAMDAQVHGISRKLLRSAFTVLALARGFPEDLGRSVLVLPACFRSFDQRPADCRRIVRSFAARWADRRRPLCVVGIRTSGSYLAPLYAAFLRSEGYQSVESMSLRPGQHWLRAERRRLDALAAAGGLALVADDPPDSGASMASAAKMLELAGVPHDSVVLLLPLFGSGAAAPASLQSYQAVLLPGECWAIHEKLNPLTIRKTLATLLESRVLRVTSDGGTQADAVVSGVERVERLPLAAAKDLRARPPSRGHVRALYRVQLVDRETSRRFEHHVYVKGTGLGYFGQQAMAIARPLRQFFPEIYGVHEGLLYRAWLPEEWRVSSARSAGGDRIALRMVSYVVARSRALATPEDVSQRSIGRGALWQRGSELLSGAFGRAALLVRPAIHRTCRAITRAPHPCVTDGTMTASHWFAVPGRSSDAPLLKVAFDEGAYTYADRCYDPLFDLAAAAAEFEADGNHSNSGAEFSHLLRQAYARMTGVPVDDEKWLLYRLLHIADYQRYLNWLWPETANEAGEELTASGHRVLHPTGEHAPSRHELLELRESGHRAQARIHQRYFGDLYFADITVSKSGPICAIDIDGVLETDRLSFPAITPAGALALRALMRHGYRPILATGRCLDEVRDRCCAYRLPGGVAEYGACVYNRGSGSIRTLLTPFQQATLGELREVLRRMPGVYVDSAYRYTVRAFRLNQDRARTGLPVGIIEEARANVEAGMLLGIVPGYAQTDFIADGVDKGIGLRALAEELDGGVNRARNGATVAFAIGDTVADIPMFGLARESFAPANVAANVRTLAARRSTRVGVMSRPHQAGLLLAVAQLLGHDPRNCRACQPPPFTDNARLLLTVLAAQDVSRWGKIRQAAALLLLVQRRDADRPMSGVRDQTGTPGASQQDPEVAGLQR